MAVLEKNHCYNLPPPKSCGYLNMACDYEKSTVVVWTRDRLLIYKDANFNKEPIINFPCLEIEKVLVHNFHLICLDTSGLLKRKKIDIDNDAWSFNLKKIFTCEIINKEYVVSLQLQDTGTPKLYINKFLEFNLQREFQIQFTDKDWQPKKRQNNLIASEYIKTKYLNAMKQIFDIQNCESEADHTLLVITLDKIHVYVCLIDLILDNNVSKNKIVKAVKLHKSHSEIVGINIINMEDEICILLGLVTGYIIKLPLINKGRNPQIFHLKSTLYKFSIIDNAIIHTDGLTMWKTENLFTKSNSTEAISKQFIVRNARDFCIIGNKLLCLTFSNLIYSLLINLSMSYVQSSNENCCPVKLVTNSQCLRKIKETVQKNEELIKNIDKEKTYVTTMALSQRPDIMDSWIQLSANVYDKYETLKEKNIELTLTDEPSHYNDTRAYFLLLRFSVATIQHKLNKILCDMLGNINIHITIIAHKVIKTVSIRLKRQLRKDNFVIPLKRNQIKSSQVEVHVKIITNIPDTNQNQWTILYQKCIVLHGSNFIVTPTFSNSICLREDSSLDELTCKIAEHLYGTLYKFSLSRHQWSTSMMLPQKNINILNNKLLYKNYWDSEKIDELLQPNLIGRIYTSETGFEFRIGDEKVLLSLTKITDSQSAMQIHSPNINLTSEIRKMFSNLIYSYYKDGNDGPEYVSCDLLDTIENQRTQIEEFLAHGTLNEIDEEFYTAVHETIFGNLPI